MRTILMLTASLAMLTGVATTASAQKLDANGRCHAKNGQFAKAEVCSGAATPAMAAKTPAMAAKAPAADPGAPYKMDAKGKCHDVKGKMAKKEMCKA